METETLTKSQQAGLDKLKALDIATAPRTKHGGIKTGVNTTVLHSLVGKGRIKVGHVWLYGVITAPLEIL